MEIIRADTCACIDPQRQRQRQAPTTAQPRPPATRATDSPTGYTVRTAAQQCAAICACAPARTHARPHARTRARMHARTHGALPAAGCGQSASAVVVTTVRASCMNSLALPSLSSPACTIPSNRPISAPSRMSRNLRRKSRPTPSARRIAYGENVARIGARGRPVPAHRWPSMSAVSTLRLSAETSELSRSSDGMIGCASAPSALQPPRQPGGPMLLRARRWSGAARTASLQRSRPARWECRRGARQCGPALRACAPCHARAGP